MKDKIKFFAAHMCHFRKFYEVKNQIFIVLSIHVLIPATGQCAVKTKLNLLSFIFPVLP